MTMTVPRFEMKNFENQEVMYKPKKTSIGIKDHKTDKLVILVNLFEEQKQNKELAAAIIETVENFLDQE